MERFLRSLDVHVKESKRDRSDVRSRFSEITDQYKNLSKTATSKLLEKVPAVRTRAQTMLNKKTYNYNATERQTSKPKYIPASQYPVPMQPRLFKPKVNSFNAERVAKLAEMRPVKVVFEEEPPIPDDSNKVPVIDIEHI